MEAPIGSLLALAVFGIAVLCGWWWMRRRDRAEAAQFLDTQGLDRGAAEPPPASTNGLGGTGPRRP